MAHLFILSVDQDFNLPATRVFVDAGRALARQYKFTHIQQLLRCVAETGLVTNKCHDDIILSCVKIVSIDQSQVRALLFSRSFYYNRSTGAPLNFPAILLYPMGEDPEEYACCYVQ